MIHEVALPTTGTLLKITRDGTVILSVEAVYIDMLLVSAQRSTRQSKINEDDRLWWLPTFTGLLNQKYNLDLSDTEAWFIARKTSDISEELKKNFESMQKSLRPNVESTPSDSLPKNEMDSTSACPSSEPNASFRSEFTNNL